MLWWLVPTWFVSLLATFFLGYYLRGLSKKLAELEQAITMKVDKKPVVEEPKSTLLDPTDEVQEAMYQHQQMLKKLNGEDYE